MLRTLPFTISEFDLGKALIKAVTTLYHWQVRAEQRYHLAELDRHALQDMGISRSQARSEARKPFFWT